MSKVIHFGTNLGFARYVWSPQAALEIARDELGLHCVEVVADNDFGPAFFLLDRKAFLEHHAAVGRHARSSGIAIPTAFTFYRDGGAVANPNPAIRRAASAVLESLAQQAAAVGARYACAALMTANRDEFDRDPRASRDRAAAAWGEWMKVAKQAGLAGLLLEMSAQPREDASTIAQTREILDQLAELHEQDPEGTTPVELCYDVGHGISREEAPDDAERDFRAWFAAFPTRIREVHLKNTDPEFLATWPFTDVYRDRGIICPEDVVAGVRDLLQGEVYLMLEIAGKRGREIGERAIVEDLEETTARWKAALRGAGYREGPGGRWEWGGEVLQ